MRAASFVLIALLLTATGALAQPVLTSKIDGAWLSLPDLPIAISNNATTSVLHDDGTSTLYSFMGITDPLDANSITPASFRLDLPGGEWVRIADAPLLNGEAKIGANAISIAGRIFLIGGYTAGGPEVTEPRLFEYLPVQDQFIEITTVPVEVDDTVAAVYRDRHIYLISGWHGPINNNVRNVQVFDTQTNTWAQATSIPGPGLFGHAGTIVDDTIIYCDGVPPTFRIAARVFVGRIDPSDPSVVDWRELPAHPGEPTYRGAGSQGSAADGRFLLVGGTDNPYNFSGRGYNGQPAFPLDQAVAFDPQDESWQSLRIWGQRPPTMDHRGLVRVSENDWAIIGGMTAMGETTNTCWVLKLQ